MHLPPQTEIRECLLLTEKCDRRVLETQISQRSIAVVNGFLYRADLAEDSFRVEVDSRLIFIVFEEAIALLLKLCGPFVLLLSEFFRGGCVRLRFRKCAGFILGANRFRIRNECFLVGTLGRLSCRFILLNFKK